jgi:hypothetical protein
VLKSEILWGRPLQRLSGFARASSSTAVAAGVVNRQLYCIFNCTNLISVFYGEWAFFFMGSENKNKHRNQAGQEIRVRKKSTLPPSTFAKVRFSSLNSKTEQNTSFNF